MIDVAVSINENQFFMSAAAIINEYNMPSRFSLYSSISDAELDDKVASITPFFPVWLKVS